MPLPRGIPRAPEETNQAQAAPTAVLTGVDGSVPARAKLMIVPTQLLPPLHDSLEMLAVRSDPC
jgi:hypothetical protein